MSLKSDFPCFEHNPSLVYLDSAATTQKPRSVIDGVTSYVEKDYSNIHRGAYALAQRSEDAYEYSKQLFGQWIGADPECIVYTYNATSAFNLIAQTLGENKILSPGDVILMPVTEHHANIVPWQMIAKRFDLQIRFFSVTQDYQIDAEDFVRQYRNDVKLVTVGHVSNVTGTIVDVQRIKTVLRPETLFVIDASQSLSHLSYDLKTLEPDFFIGTAHKCFGYTGVGMCVIHPRWIETLSPARGGGGVIQRVDQDDFAFQKGAKAQRREPGTPNLIGAVSLSKAIEYIHSQGGIAHFRSLEKPLIDYALSEFKRLKHIVRLIGSWDGEQRVGIFSFVFVDFPQWRIAQDLFAQKNICLRGGGHCTHPFWKAQGIDGALRISLSVYNDLNDLKKFFQAVEEVHDELKRFST